MGTAHGKNISCFYLGIVSDRSTYPGKAKNRLIKSDGFVFAFGPALLGQLVQPQGHLALAVGSGILVQQTAGSSLVHSLHRGLVNLIGLDAVAFADGGVKPLELGLESGLRSLVAGGLCLIDQNTLFCRLDIRQTKHLLRWLKFSHKST